MIPATLWRPGQDELGAPDRRFAIPRAGGIFHTEYDTMNIFYIIGVVVVIIVVAGFFGLRV
jgi:hypothetical protein